MIGRSLGRYEIVRRIGEGGMGVVYAARDTELEREVAIKILPDEFARDETRRTRFEREARAIASLNHPNICTLYDVGSDDGIRFLVMELIEGTSLADRLLRGPLPLPDTVRYGADIASALDGAHRSGVIHRDLKPGNVMLAKTGAKLLDFGIARIPTPGRDVSRDRTTEVRQLTSRGEILGTLRYMAPEQLEGGETDARTDIFALGILLYEMATGVLPFQGDSKVDVLSKMRAPALDALHGSGLVQPMFEHVIRKCVEFDPDDRWQSAKDVATELQWIHERREVGSTPRVGKRSILLWVAAVLTAVAAVSAYEMTREPRAAEPTPDKNGSSRLVALTHTNGLEVEPCLSPDGTNVVFVKESNGNRDIYFQRVGGTNAINLTSQCEKDDYAPAFSPDGQTIAFRSECDGGGIFLMGATGESVRRLTDFGFDPTWSPDGMRLAVTGLYSKVRFVAGNGGIHVIDVASGEREIILDGPVFNPTWSPSGTRIAFQGKSSDGSWSINSVAASGGPEVTATRIRDTDPQPWWSHDGIIYTDAVDSSFDLYRVLVDETTGRSLGEPEPVHISPEDARDPSTSVDGAKIVFSAFARTQAIALLGFDPQEGVLAGERRTVLDSRLRFLGIPRTSPDGVWVAAIMNDPGPDVALIRANTGEIRRLTNDGHIRKENLEWASDGTALFYRQTSESGSFEIWRIRPDGTERQRVFAVPGCTLSAPIPAPGTRSLYVRLSCGLDDPRWGPYVLDLTAGQDETALSQLPEIDSGRRLRHLRLSPDGRWLAGFPAHENGLDPILTLFDVETQQYVELATLEGNPLDWESLDWLPDSNRILLWRFDTPTMQIVDRRTGKVKDAGAANQDLTYFSLTPDGRNVLAKETTKEGDLWLLDHRRDGSRVR